MTNGEYAAIEAMKLPGIDSPRNRAPGIAQRADQLADGDHAMLPLRKPGERVVSS